METIRERVTRIKEGIARAARRAGRQPSEIRLIAVTKTVGLGLIREALNCGLNHFGENRVQEAIPKIHALTEGKSIWHFIGHLQTNKARQAAGFFDMIHSVDSLKLAEALHSAAFRKSQVGRRQKILIQVNISEEQTKFGVDPNRLAEVIREVARLRTLSVVGLMTIPPLFDDPERSRPYFRDLRGLAGSIAKEGIEGVSMEELSMGMSSDYEVAVEEGATWVRVGTAIFGPRETQN